MATDALETQLDTLKVGRAAREQLVEAVKVDMAKARTAIRSRVENAKASLVESAKSSVAVAVGGGIAEPVRRNLVGRLTKDIRAQGLGLALLGTGVTAVLGKVPYVREIGLGHSAVGGWLLSVSMYGSDKKPDPVKVAIEETTYKALHPTKAADK